MPTALQLNSIRKHKSALEDFKSITLKLLNRETTFVDSHIIFQSIIIEFPHHDFNKYLGLNAKIIQSPLFESAIIKIQNNEENKLSIEEKLAVIRLKKTSVVDPNINNDELSFSERALKKNKLSSITSSEYVNTNFVIPTSNDVERLFSMSKRVFSAKRRGLSTLTLEALMFLKCNRDLWNLSSVSEIVNSNTNEDDVNEDEHDVNELDDDDYFSEDVEWVTEECSE